MEKIISDIVAHFLSRVRSPLLVAAIFGWLCQIGRVRNFFHITNPSWVLTLIGVITIFSSVAIAFDLAFWTRGKFQARKENAERESEEKRIQEGQNEVLTQLRADEKRVIGSFIANKTTRFAFPDGDSGAASLAAKGILIEDGLSIGGEGFIGRGTYYTMDPEIFYFYKENRNIWQ